MNRHQRIKFQSTPAALLTFLLAWVANAQEAAPGASAPATTTPPPSTAPAAPAPAAAPPQPASINLTGQQPTTPPPPMIQLADQAPPPSAPIARTDKLHDGFYLRLNAGFASQRTSLDDGIPAANFTSTEGALSFSGLVGGAPAPGVIIGGALTLDSLPSTSFKDDAGNELKGGLLLTSIGPFIDGYPNPRGGFHLGGTIGPVFARPRGDAQSAVSKTNGVSLAAWLGYDWWVADQWSIGGLLRFAGANTWGTKDGRDTAIDARSFAILLSAVYQ